MNKVSILKAENKVLLSKFNQNEFVKVWGDDTSYFLLNDKYIIAGCGNPKEYIKEGKEYMTLIDDGNKTTKFKQPLRCEINHYAYGSKEAMEKFPKGTYTLFIIK